jgi:hypothetical protein
MTDASEISLNVSRPEIDEMAFSANCTHMVKRVGDNFTQPIRMSFMFERHTCES